MKNNKYYLLAMFFISIFIGACNQKESEIKNLENKNTELQLEDKYGVINYKKTVYEDYFRATDNQIGFTSLKANSLQKHSALKTVSYSSKNVEISINNKITKVAAKSAFIDKNQQSEIYGKTISFKVSKKGFGNSKNTESQVDLYVPKLVEIISPKIETEKELFPVCYFDNFIIEWNADSKNEEGLVVIAEYFGNNAIPSASTNNHILNVDYIEVDNGKTVLNKELFKDIPDLSFVHIILLRGNVKVEEIEGELYKFFAESHVRLPIILSKDLNSLTK